MLWFWGLCGAFVYAAPRLLETLREAVVAPGPTRWELHVAEFIIALITGPIMAYAITPQIGHRIPWLVEPNSIALAVAIGFMANEGAPKLSRAMLRGLAKRIEAGA